MNIFKSTQRKLSKRASKLISKRSKLSREIQRIQLDVDMIEQQIKVCVHNIELLSTSNHKNSSTDHGQQLQHDCEFLRFLQTQLADKKVHLQKLVSDNSDNYFDLEVGLILKDVPFHQFSLIFISMILLMMSTRLNKVLMFLVLRLFLLSKFHEFCLLMILHYLHVMLPLLRDYYYEY